MLTQAGSLRILLLSFFIACTATTPTHAAKLDKSLSRSGGTVPQIIADGMEKYQFSGPAAGIKSWMSYGEGNVPPDTESYISALTQAEANYGKFVGYSVVHYVQISPNVSLTYLVFNYERGPLFARFTTYQYKSLLIVTEMELNPKLSAIFPEKLRQ